MGENLPPMSFSEIRPFYRRRDWLLWVPEQWRNLTLFAGILWRRQERGRMGVFTAWTIAFHHNDNPRFRAALRRTCLARGYECVPCELQYQLPERSRR